MKAALKNYAVHQQTYLTNLMLRRGVLTSDDTIYKSFSVFVSGTARSFIRTKETNWIAINSMDVDNKLDILSVAVHDTKIRNNKNEAVELMLQHNETKKIRISYKVRYPKDKIIDNL